MASSSSNNLIQSNQHHSQHRSPFTKIKQDFELNVAAPPFVCPVRASTFARALRGGESMPEIGYIGPTQLPVNSRVWSSISSYPLDQLASYESTTSNKLFQYYQKQQHRGVSPTPSSNYEPLHQFGPTVLANGIIQLRLRNSVVIEMTIDHSVKLMNHHERVTIALSSTGTSSALTHPNGIVFQNGSRVDIVVFDGRKKNPYVRYAKMWHKGISLTSEGCALIYLVDAAGTRTTSDAINIDPKVDYINPVFHNGSRIGTQFYQEANQIAQCCNFWLNDDGTEIFHLNGFRIQQTVDGLVKVARMNNRCNIRTSPTNGSATITTSYIHCTASMGQTSHLFVRREERRMHFDGSSFVVRNAGHSAGFDEWNRLRVY
ncbi:uncharacterized protein LOC129779222 [Toxorhynchites rutilus septentrionalis]|uniref:uncharacterized protein LOC129779222 n=1 Tax=Toxorhynchites rutilus septentrionalis TaxID=329112 RepID=UPI00247A220E|nr:uncharacterized protein LOC129779222 [Toxorhynchites rutilus septentrionalis]